MLKYMTGPITKADSGGLDAIISTPRVDKDAESVDPLGLINREEWLSNPLIFWAHEWAYNPSAEPIGKGTRLEVFRDRIESSAVYAPTPKAQNVRALVLGGFVRKTSIGFDPRTMKAVEGVPTHTQWALREWSIVPMPSNVDATITGVKSALQWFADQIPDATEDDNVATLTLADTAQLEALVRLTVADQLTLSSDTPNVVRLRDGNRVIASIRRRRVAIFPSSS